MTELPINCCPGSTTPVSPHCIAEDYLMRHCPILKEVNKASKHACPLKEADWKSPEEWNKNEIKRMNIVQGMREAK
jgi:hypothetical protein